MAINFPSNPTNAQEVTEGNVTYVYNATKGYWESSEVSSGGASTTVYADMAALIAATGMSNGDQAFVIANNNLYIYSGSGWYKIATVQNDSPSAITGVAGSYELAIDGTATTITAVSTDPEGFPLTWSYSTSGLGSIATISNTDNVFTITPSTTETDAGTFSLTINATDGVNGAVNTSTNLTLNFIVTVTDSNYTTLLATAVNTSDNNNITDASSNNHSITVNGDAHAGTFSPYRSGGYSTYFDGTGDYLSISSNASLNFDYDAFTIEFWVQSSVKTNFQTVAAKYDTSDTTGFFILLNSSGNLLFGTNPSNYITSSGTDICDGAWHHISCTRSVSSGVGTMTIYIDGSSAGTLNRLDNVYNVVDFEIGRQNAVNRPLTGYVSDLRVVKGTAITPPSSGPTERLEAVTNTSLLTCHLPYISDGSSNDHSITVNGDPEIKPFSPYDYNEYSATNNGGSVYFDGTGDYLSISNQGISGDLTYEGWFYQTVAPTATYRTLISSSTYASGVPFRVYTNNTNIQVWTSGSGGAEITETFKPYTWFHIAIVRSSGTWTLYVNGKSAGTTTVGGTYDFASTTGWSVGGSQTGSYPFTGYASDVKLTNSAVYSSNFTPPTSPLSSSGAELHIKGTDASIIDKSQGANLKLGGNTTGSTTQVKFAGTKSMYFDGSGDYIDATQNWIQLRTSDFTIETWFYPTATPSNHEGIFCYGAHGSGNYLQLLYQTNRLIRYDIYADVGGGSTVNLSTTAVSLNTWNHIALCRSGGNIRLYVNGTQEHTEANSSDLNFTPPNNGYETIAVIGNRTGLSGYELNSAYLQDFRVTKGLTRYTANFTPPTEPLKG